MANYEQIHKIIDDAIALDLANPNFAISDKERLLKNAAVRLGCMDYYRCFPMRTVYVTTYSTTGDANGTFTWTGITPPHVEDGTTYITFDELLSGCTPKIPADYIEHAQFLGVLRMERPYFSNFSNPSLWSLQMFGMNFGGNQFTTDPLTMLANNTYDELSTGQPKYTIDTMQQRLIIYPPFGIGQLSMSIAVGFDSPEFVEYSKVDFLCHFISYRFIESIIQARDGVQFDADFKLSTEALQRRLEKLKEVTDSYKNHTVLKLAAWS